MPVLILLSSNPDNLAARAPHVTVEAEYGDRVVTGSILTMAHHGPRTGGRAPCAYSSDCMLGALPPGETTVIGLSHVDLDTVGGVMAALGVKPSAPSFWALAEFLDLHGSHKLARANASAADLAILDAYLAFSTTARIFPPRDGSVLDVTQSVMAHVNVLLTLLDGTSDGTTTRADLLARGASYRAGEAALNVASFVSVEAGVIFRRAPASGAFVNHLYTTPDGTLARGVVTHNPHDAANGAVTVSLADPTPGVSCGDLVRALYGPLAGGHAGIGGAPRGVALPESDALRAVEALRAALAFAGVT